MLLPSYRHLLLIIVLVWSTSVLADDILKQDSTQAVESAEQDTINNDTDDESTQAPDLWGISLAYRIAEIPYASDEDTVSDVVPLIFYENGRFFWRGLEAGYTFADYDEWSLSVLGRYRFFDIPAEFQNRIRGNGTDLGLRYRFKFTEELNTDIELMDDTHGRTHANFRLNYDLDSGDWDVLPFANLRWKSSKYNNYYYGLGIDSPGSDFDLSIGATVRYHVISNFYLLGRATFTQFGPNTYRTSVVDTPNQTELFLGIAFFDDKNKPKHQYLKSKSYVRLAHGKATPSNIGEIIRGNKEPDPGNNKLTSVFYGIPVSDTLFGLDIPIYFTPGYVWHQSSANQDNFAEYVIALKAYYTIKWPTRWRIGAAEGLSYATQITAVEQGEMDRKGYRASNLLNYLDFSVDVDLGDLFNSETLENVWLGYSIHHRSGIFETSSAFGRIKGGSNYTTFYLQYHW